MRRDVEWERTGRALSRHATVVLAPDSFKASATAGEVAEALARGWRAERPQDTLIELPLADGGEGTLDCLERAVPGSVRYAVTVAGPQGAPVAASWLLLPDGTGVVELASTCGLTLAAPNALTSSTRGFGQAIAAALDHGVEGLLLAIGGSASTDGGAGALSALGARLTKGDGEAVPPGGVGLLELARVDLAGLRPLPPGGATVLCDVIHPLTGPGGAAHVFGPQKGASHDDVILLDTAMERWSDLVREADSRQPGAGAAGGTGFGLFAWGARPSSGAATVLEFTGLSTFLASADAVVTGEGQYDDQSASGKLVSHVLAAALDTQIEAFLVAGRIVSPPTGYAASVELVALAGGVRSAMERPLRWISKAGAQLARDFVRGRGDE